MTAHLLHRNVCPASILVTRRGTWKLAGLEFAGTVLSIRFFLFLFVSKFDEHPAEGFLLNLCLLFWWCRIEDDEFCLFEEDRYIAAAFFLVLFEGDEQVLFL